jgi:hypothetical protein
MRWDAIVCFVNIGEIVDHHYLNFNNHYTMQAIW